MKQIIQNYRTGIVELAEVPVPMCSSDTLLVRNMASLVSIGTERSVVELGQKSLLGKAKARPDLVKPIAFAPLTAKNFSKSATVKCCTTG